eukprot:6490851-Amphidinium_carterae.3
MCRKFQFVKCGHRIRFTVRNTKRCSMREFALNSSICDWFTSGRSQLPSTHSNVKGSVGIGSAGGGISSDSVTWTGEVLTSVGSGLVVVDSATVVGMSSMGNPGQVSPARHGMVNSPP